MPFKAADPRVLLSDQAMFDVGYLPPNTPPGERAGGSYSLDNGLEGGRPARQLRANFCRTHPQQKQRAFLPSRRRG